MVTNKSKTYPISVTQRDNLINSAFSTAVDILFACKAIVSVFEKPLGNQTEYFCAGLYTHALEEYGKILWLKNLPDENGIVKINYPEYGGRYAHTIKFNLILADEKLPDICKQFGGEKWGVGGSMDEAIAIIQNTTTIDQFVRFQLFYSDFDDNGNPLPYPKIDKDFLIKSIDELLKFLQGEYSEFTKKVQEKG